MVSTRLVVVTSALHLTHSRPIVCVVVCFLKRANDEQTGSLSLIRASYIVRPSLDAVDGGVEGGPE
eukprot:3555244-Pyramimonas_sp.AAC.1